MAPRTGLEEAPPCLSYVCTAMEKLQVICTSSVMSARAHGTLIVPLSRALQREPSTKYYSGGARHA